MSLVDAAAPADSLSLWLGQVGGSPTVSVEVRPAFATAVRDNKEIATKVVGRTQSARRASLYCTLAALRATADAMGVVDSLVDHFGGSPADRSLLCEASTTVTASDALTADTAALWALEQPGMAGGGAGDVPLVRS